MSGPSHNFPEESLLEEASKMTGYFSPHVKCGSRKFVTAACLAVSLALHLAALIVVLQASTQQKAGQTITFIDIGSIADALPPATPVIHAPPPEPADTTTEQPAILPESIPDSAPPPNPATAVTPPPPDLRTTSLGRGMASGYFTSFAEGKSLRDDTREYYFELLEKINQQWWLKAETLKESVARDGAIMFVIGRDGELVEAQMVESTGSREVDLAILEVLKAAAPFQPLPASYPHADFRAPMKIAAPLSLFNFKNIK